MSLSLFAMILSNSLSDGPDKVRLSFEASSAFWFGWVKYAGYAVAAGCAMEAPETLAIIKRWWLLKFRNEEKEETKEDKKSWRVPLAAIGLIVIVVGILIETFAEGKVSDVDALLRAHESDKITAAEAASATREAGNAKDSAIIAKSAADVAERKAAGAESLAETAEEKAGSANDAADEAAARANEANESVDAVGKRAEQIDALLAKSINRRDVDISKFVELLKGKPKGSVEIWYEPNDSEVLIFALQLEKALGSEGAGWEVKAERFPTDHADRDIVPRKGLNLIRIEADDDGMAMGVPNSAFDQRPQRPL